MRRCVGALARWRGTLVLPLARWATLYCCGLAQTRGIAPHARATSSTCNRRQIPSPRAVCACVLYKGLAAATWKFSTGERVLFIVCILPHAVLTPAYLPASVYLLGWRGKAKLKRQAWIRHGLGMDSALIRRLLRPRAS